MPLEKRIPANRSAISGRQKMYDIQFSILTRVFVNGDMLARQFGFENEIIAIFDIKLAFRDEFNQTIGRFPSSDSD